MRGRAISRSTAAVFFLAVSALSAAAVDLPNRKAGLWEVDTDANGHALKMQQCVDATTDYAMQARGGVPHGDCSKHDVQKSANTTTIDTVCTVAGKTRTSHIVIVGSFDSNYTLTVTTQAEGQPARPPVTLTAKWLGPCAADQRPGDIIMPNGAKMNITNMPGGQKGTVPPGAPGAPPGH
jgi:Protein of unknown function (DUF3617)